MVEENPMEKFEKRKKIREIAGDLKKQGINVSLSTLTTYFEKYDGAVALEAALEKFAPTSKQEEFTTTPVITTPIVKKAPITLVLEEKTYDKTPTKNKEPIAKGSWQENYLASIEKYSDLDIDKKTDEKRRFCKGSIEANNLNIDLTPTPEFAKRREQAARYEFAESESKDKIAVTIQAKQYKDFAILFKAAKENGVNVIEFNKTQTDEFRHLALAAALSLGLEVKNAPGVVDMSAEYLTRMPPKAREALEKHNEKIRKNIEKNKEEYTPKPVSKPFVKPIKGIGD